MLIAPKCNITNICTASFLLFFFLFFYCFILSLSLFYLSVSSLRLTLCAHIKHNTHNPLLVHSIMYGRYLQMQLLLLMCSNRNERRPRFKRFIFSLHSVLLFLSLSLSFPLLCCSLTICSALQLFLSIYLCLWMNKKLSLQSHLITITPFKIFDISWSFVSIEMQRIKCLCCI